MGRSHGVYASVDRRAADALRSRVKTTKLRESIDGESSEQWEADFATRAGDEAAGENTLGEAESANSASE